MENIIEYIQSQMSDQLIDQLSNRIGSDSKEKTEAATNGIVSTLVAAMARNTTQSSGANALASALDRDHDGSVLDDIMGFVSGKSQPANNRALNGLGILQHTLGAKQSTTAEALSKMSGLDAGKVSQLMVTLAPIIMGALGKARKSQQVSTGGLSELLGRSVRSETNKRTETNLLTRLLDSDGDGSIMDDIANIGINAFLRKR